MLKNKPTMHVCACNFIEFVSIPQCMYAETTSIISDLYKLNPLISDLYRLNPRIYDLTK